MQYINAATYSKRSEKPLTLPDLRKKLTFGWESLSRKSLKDFHSLVGNAPFGWKCSFSGIPRLNRSEDCIKYM